MCDGAHNTDCDEQIGVSQVVRTPRRCACSHPSTSTPSSHQVPFCPLPVRLRPNALTLYPVCTACFSVLFVSLSPLLCVRFPRVVAAFLSVLFVHRVLPPPRRKMWCRDLTRDGDIENNPGPDPSPLRFAYIIALRELNMPARFVENCVDLSFVSAELRRISLELADRAAEWPEHMTSRIKRDSDRSSSCLWASDDCRDIVTALPLALKNLSFAQIALMHDIELNPGPWAELATLRANMSAIRYSDRPLTRSTVEQFLLRVLALESGREFLCDGQGVCVPIKADTLRRIAHETQLFLQELPATRSTAANLRMLRALHLGLPTVAQLQRIFSAGRHYVYNDYTTVSDLRAVLERTQHLVGIYLDIAYGATTALAESQRAMRDAEASRRDAGLLQRALDVVGDAAQDARIVATLLMHDIELNPGPFTSDVLEGIPRLRNPLLYQHPARPGLAVAYEPEDYVASVVALSAHVAQMRIAKQRVDECVLFALRHLCRFHRITRRALRRWTSFALTRESAAHAAVKRSLERCYTTRAEFERVFVVNEVYAQHLPDITAINRPKKERNAVRAPAVLDMTPRPDWADCWVRAQEIICARYIGPATSALVPSDDTGPCVQPLLDRDVLPTTHSIAAGHAFHGGARDPIAQVRTQRGRYAERMRAIRLARQAGRYLDNNHVVISGEHVDIAITQRECDQFVINGDECTVTHLENRELRQLVRALATDLAWNGEDTSLWYTASIPYRRDHMKEIVDCESPHCFHRSLAYAMNEHGLLMERNFMQLANEAERYVPTCEHATVRLVEYNDQGEQAVASRSTVAEIRARARDPVEGYAGDREILLAAVALRVRIFIVLGDTEGLWAKSYGVGPTIHLYHRNDHFQAFRMQPVDGAPPPPQCVTAEEPPLLSDKLLRVHGRTIRPVSDDDSSDSGGTGGSETATSAGSVEVGPGAVAEGKGKLPPLVEAPGTGVWMCHTCSLQNINSLNCRKCRRLRINVEQPDSVANDVWKCAQCTIDNYGSTHCRQCSRKRCNVEITTVVTVQHYKTNTVAATGFDWADIEWRAVDATENCLEAARHAARYYHTLLGTGISNTYTALSTSDSRLLLADGVNIMAGNMLYNLGGCAFCYYEVAGSHVRFVYARQTKNPRNVHGPPYVSEDHILVTYQSTPGLRITDTSDRVRSAKLVVSSVVNVPFIGPTLYAEKRHYNGCKALTERLSMTSRILHTTFVNGDLHYATPEEGGGNCDCGACALNFEDVAPENIRPAVQALLVRMSNTLSDLSHRDFEARLRSLAISLTQDKNTSHVVTPVLSDPDLYAEAAAYAWQYLKRSSLAHARRREGQQNCLSWKNLVSTILRSTPTPETVLCTQITMPAVYGACTRCGRSTNSARACTCDLATCACGRYWVYDAERKRTPGAKSICAQRYCSYCDTPDVCKRLIETFPTMTCQPMLLWDSTGPDLPRPVPMFALPAISAQKMGVLDPSCTLQLFPFPAVNTEGPHACGILVAESIPFCAARDFPAVQSSMTARMCATTPKCEDFSKPGYFTTSFLEMFEAGSIMPCEPRWFCERWSGSKRQDMFDALEHLSHTPLTVYDCRRALFLKSEKLTKDLNGKGFAARVISSTTPRAQLALGVYTWAISKWLAKTWNGENTFFGWKILYASPLRTDETARILKGVYEEGYTHVADGDYGTFDATEGEPVIRNEHRFYRHLCRLSRNASLALKCQVAPRGSFVIRGQKVATFACKGRRQSGDPNTTLGNTLNSAMTTLAVFDDLGLPPGFMALAGDDVIWMMPYSLVQHMPAIVARYRYYGFNMEAQTRLSPFDAHFLGSRPLPCSRCVDGKWEPTWILAPEMGRCLPKFGWSLDPQAQPRNWARQVAVAFRHMSFVPVLGAFIRNTLAMTSDEVARKPLKLRDMPHSLRQGGFLDPHSASSETYVAFALSYGVSLENIDAIEKRVDMITKYQVPLPCFVSHPALEVLCTLG